MALAMIVTIIGFLMLLDKMGIISSTVWSYFWPLVIVFIGLSMMFNKMNHGHYFDDCCLRGEHWGKKNRRKRSRS